MTYEENVRAILESNFAGFKEEVIDTACKAICGLRTYGEWIPCDEQLPKKQGYYVVQTDGSRGHVVDISEFGKLWSNKCGDFDWGWNKASRVIAWMPLPEPYGKEEIPKTYPNKLACVGFSQHDCESHYKCPFCGEHYGSYSIPIGKPFKCKCGRYVWTD